ncbi:hypothetical protein [Ponticaulis koreensis]|uniref:hypothetical protein n=1 Tax=Ponticaulis koreensis TaxID=1123045 RepID=UPI0003B4EC07|nr:hypothetical protein [Ponticaulis koreensis]
MQPFTRVTALMGMSSCLTLSAQADLPIQSFEASCDAWGIPAVCTSVWSEGLSPHLHVQDYRIAHADTGDTIFAGRGVYRVDGEDVTGYWEDSQGNIHRLTGSWLDGALEVTWGETDTPVGKSRYEFSDDGMSAEDWSVTANDWQSFMTVSYPANDAN